MTADLQKICEKLVKHLGCVAEYNDKGWIWSHHGPDIVGAEQQRAQAVIFDLVAAIGEEAFSASLLQKLKSGATARDDSGDIYLQAKAELLPGESAD